MRRTLTRPVTSTSCECEFLRPRGGGLPASSGQRRANETPALSTVLCSGRDLLLRGNRLVTLVVVIDPLLCLSLLCQMSTWGLFLAVENGSVHYIFCFSRCSSRMDLGMYFSVKR